jgi:hypothetical protein
MHVIFWPAGQRQGTQAKLLAERLRVPDIATGEMLRKAVLEGTPLGGKVKVRGVGRPCPDDLMIALIREARRPGRRGWVRPRRLSPDGRPCARPRAILKGNEKSVDIVLNLASPNRR